jgi:mevalonate kinase
LILRAKKIKSVALDIQGENMPTLNFAIGAGLGSSAILVLAITYVLAKKLRVPGHKN